MASKVVTAYCLGLHGKHEGYAHTALGCMASMKVTSMKVTLFNLRAAVPFA